MVFKTYFKPAKTTIWNRPPCIRNGHKPCFYIIIIIVIFSRVLGVTNKIFILRSTRNDIESDGNRKFGEKTDFPAIHILSL